MKNRTKLIIATLLIISINILITLTLIHLFVWSKIIYIEPGTKINQDLSLTEGTIIISENSDITGKINLDEGQITIKENSHIAGDIHLSKGDLEIDQGTTIVGNISIDQGNLTLSANTKIEGDIKLGKGELQKHSTASISGKKPPLFITYDWPKALAYFDALPQPHKDAVGYIFLTKTNNTSIRDSNILKATDYFEGIYYYKNHQLLSIDLNNQQLTKPFFENAEAFFKGLPERRLGPFSVGATTKNFAINPSKADIYVPAEGSKYTFIHEMGHVVDYQKDFSDLHNPKYPFISKEVALNSYGATHPGEDFAEAYKYYVVSPEYFLELIKEQPERQEKYDYLKKYVFNDQEYFS
jgi:hypothetical protein